MSIYNVQWASAGAQGIPGKSTIILPDNDVDNTTTSLTLNGRDVVNYGQIQQTNFIQLLEHFASGTSPLSPTIGQLWFNPSVNILYVCVYPNISTVVTKPVSTAIAGTSSPVDNSWWAPTSVNYVPLNSAGGTMTGNIIMNGYTVTGLPSPVNSSDAVNKGYVDSASASLNVHAPVVTATTGNIVSNYYIGNVDTNGGTGIGAQLMSQSPAVLTISGVTPSIGDRVLVKNQTSAYQNGVYTLTTTGSGSINWILTRAADYNDSVNGNPPQVSSGDYVYVTGGTLAGTSWVQQGVGTGGNNTILIGTDQINFVLFNSATAYVAGTGLALNGTTFSNTGVLSLTSGTNINVTGTGGALTISVSGIVPNAVASAQTSAVSVSPSNSNSSFFPVFTSTGTGLASIVTSSKLAFNPSTGALTATSFVGALTGNAQTASSATVAGSIAGGGVGYIPYQSASGNTTLLAPAANGTVLTLIGGVPSWQVPPGGAGGGVTSLTGTANQIVASGSTGAITLSLPSTINVNTTGTAANITGTYAGTISLSQITTALGYVPQAALGFTPIQQGGGIGDTANKIYIGWDVSVLNLQVDSTNYGNTWPINISGTSVSANTAMLSTTQAVGTNNTTIATTQFVQSQIATTGAVSSAFWCYTNPATLSSNGFVNYQTSSPDCPVGITSYSAGTITIAISGMYHISASATVGANNSTIGIGQLSMYQNGSAIPGITNKWSDYAVNSSAQNYDTVHISGLIFCSVGDTIQINYFNNGQFGALLTGFGQFFGFKIA